MKLQNVPDQSTAKPAALTPVPDGADVLRDWVERVAREALGRRSHVVSVCRERSVFSSSYESSVVTALFSDGEEVRFFLKDFGACQSGKDQMAQRRQRELQVYRELLCGADLGTARYYDALWDQRTGRFWLLLEFVDGQRVKYCELDDWVRAVGWLGRLHGRFAHCAGQLSRCAFLQVQDAALFESAARKALRVVSEIDAQWAGRLEAIVAKYDRLIPTLVGTTPTLVHGSFGQTDVLVDNRNDPPRICPVDWELAGYGHPMGDFAYFTDGFAAPLLLRAWQAYRCEAAEQGLATPHDQAEMTYEVDCFRLHRRLNRLGQALERRWERHDVVRMLDEVEQLQQRVLQRGRDSEVEPC